MKQRVTVFYIAMIGLLLSGALQSCKNKEPSILRVFVRSHATDLQADAKVVIIADIPSNTSDKEFVDTVLTNESGIAHFNLDPYFSEVGEGNEVAFFRIIARKNGTEGTSKVRTRVHTTAVETVYLSE